MHKQNPSSVLTAHIRTKEIKQDFKHPRNIENHEEETTKYRDHEEGAEIPKTTPCNQ